MKIFRFESLFFSTKAGILVWQYGLMLVLFFFFSTASAETSPHYNINLKNIAQQILLFTDQEKVLNKKITQLEAEVRQLEENPPTDYQKAMQLQNQIKVRGEMTEILLNDLTQTLNVTQQRAKKLLEKQKNIQVQLLNEQNQEEKTKIGKRLHYTTELIKLNQKENDLLVQNLALAQKLNGLYLHYRNMGLMFAESIDKRKSIQALHQQVIAEQRKTDFWLGKINELNAGLHGSKKSSIPQKITLQEQIVNEGHLFYYTQKVHLSSLEITLLELSIREKKTDEDFKKLSLDSSNNGKISELKEGLSEDTNTLGETGEALEQYQQLMKKQEALLENALQNKWLNVNNAKMLKNNLKELDEESQLIQKMVAEKQANIHKMQEELQNYISKMVAKRDAILQTDENIIVGFLSQVSELPRLLKGYIVGLAGQVWHSLTLAKAGIKLLIGVVLSLSGLAWWFGRKYFHILSIKMSDSRQRMASNIVYVLSELFLRNWGSLCLFLNIWFILYLSGINFDAYIGIFYTAMIWFIFRVIMGIARILLVERDNNEQEGHDVALYHRLKWVFIIGGWVTVFVALSKQFGMSGIMFDLSNRLFMAFLLTVSIVLIRARNVLPSVLDPFFANRKYLARTIRTVCWCLPFGFFVSTALGVLGYMTLSWILIAYQASLVLIVAAYMILRGLAADLFDISSEWMIQRLNQGWLWSEAFLKPIDRLFRICLFLGMIVSIFFVLGWRNDSLVVTKLREVLFYPFFYFSGINVTLFSIVELFALISFCFWSAKWTREFTYRWVFRNAKDIGIRNSLAVFCQYLVIALGTIITLRTLGIDFTGLSMILGGLAVGLGFGLRDLASNIVGGIMLLIERSVKEGDIVSIGTYEGEVMHIGIRAMRLRSWDFMEIMVPNSEILLKTFVNWTHQDNVVRTVIPMAIHRLDDPFFAQQMILDLLKNVPEVLAQPISEVFFTNMNSPLIEFDVRYFINVALYDRPCIRSKVVLLILEAFKAAGFRPPYGQQDSYVWDVRKLSEEHEKKSQIEELDKKLAV
jgi:potassium-dependent mechanosensitive channel